MSLQPGDEYTCSVCHGTFRAVSSEEEAMAESEEVFGFRTDDPAVVCDVCWHEFLPWAESEGLIAKAPARPESPDAP